MAMTANEVALLRNAGQLFIRNFAYLVPLTLLYGTYVLLAALAMYTLMRRSKTRSMWALSALLTISFCIVTVYFTLYAATSFRLVQVGLTDNTDLSLAQRFNLASASILRLQIAQLWVGGVNGLLFIFGDAIVVWRAWAVWTGRRNVAILPGFLLLATFAIFLTSSSLRTRAFVNPSIIEPSSLFGSLVIAGFSLSIATNCVSTLLIGIKAYQHRKFMKDTIGVGNSVVVKVLMFLTESGVVYIVFQIINICVAFLDNAPPNSPLNIASHVWGVIMNLVAAIYPTLVILIVNYRSSLTKTVELSEETSSPVRHSIGTHLSFARSPNTVATTNTSNGRTTQMELGELEKKDEPDP
ncbi:hypothetical protein C8J56DRAFT_981360 [Mycena floridula]|nr:hypothetical protein C8J56DRAFT_981360 [Mycena floridula]